MRAALDALTRGIRTLVSLFLGPVLLLLLWTVYGKQIIGYFEREVSANGWPQLIFTLITIRLFLPLITRSVRLMTGLTKGQPRAVSLAPLIKASGLTAEDRDDAEEFDPTMARRARHEAAHALVVYKCGASVDRLDVLVTANHGGLCQWSMSAQKHSIAEMAWIELLCALAGNEIDLQAGHRDQGSRDDMNLALVAAAGVISTGSVPTGVQAELSTDSLLAAGRVQVRALLSEHAELLEAIAEHLMGIESGIWYRPDLAAMDRQLSAKS